MRLAILASLLALFVSPASAEVQYLKSGIGVTFDGCDFDKLINLKNGYAWMCNGYGYEYHYGYMTVLGSGRDFQLCPGDLEKAMERYREGRCYTGTLHTIN